MTETNTCWTKFHPRDHHLQAEPMHSQNALCNTVHTRCVLHTSGPPADRERWSFCCAKTKKTSLSKNTKSVYMGSMSLTLFFKASWPNELQPKHINVSFKITKPFQTCARVKAQAGKKPKPIFRDWSKSITGFSTSRAKHLLPSHFVAENHRYVADW